MSDLSPDEAEIEASRAPLLDHLIELRSRLIICVGSIIVGFGICFFFSTQIYVFLTHPFELAGQIFSAQQKGEAKGPFDLFFVVTGLKSITAVAGGAPSMISTAPLEFFFTKLKLAGFGAVILTFPVLAWQVYAFVAPGLYKRERHAFLPFLVAAPVLFLMGASLVYYIILPFVLWFSLSQQIIGTAGVQVQMLPKVSDYLTLVTTLVLAFGLCFQLPVVLTLLGLARIVTSKMLMAGWRYAVLGVVVVAAVVTPPDPISQLLLATPIILLYFVSVGCVKLIEIRRPADEDEGATA